MEPPPYNAKAPLPHGLVFPVGRGLCAPPPVVALTNFPAGVACPERCRREPPPYKLPLKRKNFPLIWPILRTRDEARAHRIQAHIVPLVAVGFIVSQQMVKELLLPGKRREAGFANLLLRPVLPAAYKVGQVFPFPRGRGSEEMNMVRHHYIASNHPALGGKRPFPCANKYVVDSVAAQYLSAMTHTYRQVEKRRSPLLKDSFQPLQVPPFRQGGGIIGFHAVHFLFRSRRQIHLLL